MATGPVGGRGRDDDDSDIVGMLKGCRWLEWVGGYGRAEGELSHAQAGYQRGLGQRDSVNGTGASSEHAMGESSEHSGSPPLIV